MIFFLGSIKSIWNLTSWHVDAFNSQIQLIWIFKKFFDIVLFLVQWLAHLLCFYEISNIFDLIIYFIILNCFFHFLVYQNIKILFYLFIFYYVFIIFSFIFISWRLITSQHFSGFCHTLTWISHGVTCIPHPDHPSHLPLQPIPLGLPSTPGLSTCLMLTTWASDLFHYT